MGIPEFHPRSGDRVQLPGTALVGKRVTFELTGKQPEEQTYAN
jgi:hypothetical protein